MQKIFRSLQLDIQFLGIDLPLSQKGLFLYKKYFVLVWNFLFGFTVGVSFVKVFGRKYFYDDVFGVAFLQSVYVDHAMLKKYITGGGTVVDVGANIGQFTFFCKQYLHAHQVYSFEPVTKSYKVLRKNSEDASFHRAISPHTQVEISIPRCTSLMASSFPLAEDDEKETVAGVRLDDVPELQEHLCIDLLKIDTEGSEFGVLQTAVRTLQKSKLVLIEVSLNRPSDASFMETIAFFKEHVPALKVISIGRVYVDMEKDLAVDILLQNNQL